MAEYKSHLLIKYLTNCRDCLKSNGITNAYYYITHNKYELNALTEYELSKQIVDWKKEDPHVCPFCDSYNIELYNFFIDYSTEIYKSYDFDRLAKTMNKAGERCFWQFNINKRENKLQVDVGGTLPQYEIVTKDCVKKLFEELETIPIKAFKTHPRGLFSVCFSVFIIRGDHNNPYEIKLNSKLEKLLYHGIAKDEIVSAILKFYKDT